MPFWTPDKQRKKEFGFEAFNCARKDRGIGPQSLWTSHPAHHRPANFILRTTDIRTFSIRTVLCLEPVSPVPCLCSLFLHFSMLVCLYTAGSVVSSRFPQYCFVRPNFRCLLFSLSDRQHPSCFVSSLSSSPIVLILLCLCVLTKFWCHISPPFPH